MIILTWQSECIEVMEILPRTDRGTSGLISWTWNPKSYREAIIHAHRRCCCSLSMPLGTRRILDRSAKRKRVDVAGCLELAGCKEAIGHNFEPNRSG